MSEQPKYKLRPLESFGYVTPKDYTAYLKFNLLKGRYYRLKVMAVLLCLGTVCAWLLLAGITKGNKSRWIAAGAIALCAFMFIYTVNVNVKRICNKAIILSKGQLIAEGDVDEICDVYKEMVNSR